MNSYDFRDMDRSLVDFLDSLRRLKEDRGHGIDSRDDKMLINCFRVFLIDGRDYNIERIRDWLYFFQEDLLESEEIETIVLMAHFAQIDHFPTLRFS